MDCSPPDCSVHGILQARILGWVAMFFRGSSWLRVEPTSLKSPALASGFFTTNATRKPEQFWYTGKMTSSVLVVFCKVVQPTYGGSWSGGRWQSCHFNVLSLDSWWYFFSFLKCCYYFWPHCTTCGILIMPPALENGVLTTGHWGSPKTCCFWLTFWWDYLTARNKMGGRGTKMFHHNDPKLVLSL